MAKRDWNRANRDSLMAKRPQESSIMAEIREIALKREQKTHLLVAILPRLLAAKLRPVGLK